MAVLGENALKHYQRIKEYYENLRKIGYSKMRAYRKAGQQFGKSTRQIMRIIKKDSQDVN